MNNALQQYRSVDLAASAQTASPHQLITMLLQGALETLAKTRGAIERGDIQQRTALINKASAIVLELQGSLDKEKGADLAENLDQLYSYILLMLMKANRENDSARVEEASKLLVEVLDGWSQIPPELRGQQD